MSRLSKTGPGTPRLSFDMLTRTEIQIRADVLTTATHTLHRFTAMPANPAVARVILLHGYGDHAGKYHHFLAWMAEHGILAEAVDFRGHGRSSGPVARVSRWEEYLQDLVVMMQDNASSPRLPLFVVAHSHGALIAAIAALDGLLVNVSGVVLSAPFLELKIPVPMYKRVFAEVASWVLPGVRIKSGIGGPMLTHDPELIEINRTDPYCPGVATPRWFTTTRKMQARARAAAADFKLPLLMLVAGEDVIADARVSVAFFNAAGSVDKQIREYHGLRHELLRELGREAIFQEILDWIQQRCVRANLFTAETPRRDNNG